MIHVHMEPALHQIISILSGENKSVCDPDWDIFLTRALEHRLYPVLSRRIDPSRHSFIPGRVFHTLGLWYAANSLRMRELFIELVCVTGKLEAAGIPVISMKGPALAARIYGDISLRASGDLDIVVSGPDFGRAVRVIRSLDYESEDYNFEKDRRVYRQFTQGYTHHAFQKEKPACRLELHRTLCLPRFREYRNFPDRFEDLLAASVWIDFSGCRVRLFSDRHLFLYLLMHGEIHRWSRLGWLLDIDRLLRGPVEVDWERVNACCRSRKIMGMLQRTISLCRSLFRSPIPPDLISGRVFPGAMIAASGYSKEHRRRSWGISMKNRIYGMIHRLLPPLNDVARIKLPLPFLGLHFLLRPVFILYRKMKRLQPSRRGFPLG